MNIFLTELAKVNQGKKIAIVMDGAGWHKSDKLILLKKYQNNNSASLFTRTKPN